MLYRLLTDLTVAVHFAFLVFVVAGGFLARRHRWLVIPHVLAAAWGVYVEATPGLVCPLTPLENAFAIRAGEAGYQGSFIEHYLVPIIYPEGLTRGAQWGLAAFVVAINAVAYGWPRGGRDRQRAEQARVQPRTIPSESMLQIRGLRKAFGSLQAVDGVSFEIGAGQIVGVLGPNGAGKTTTVSLIAGLLRADGGDVLIEGSALRGDSDPAKRKLGLVPQELALYDELSARENLRFFGGLQGVTGPALDRAIASTLLLVGLQDRASHRVGTFSGGMKRRLNLAAGLLHDPEILLLDEPTVGVDPQSRNAIFDNLETLKKQGKALLYTTHYMEEAQRLCDRIVIIDQGKVVAQDTLRGLYRSLPAQNQLTVEFAAPLADGPWLAEVRALSGVTSATTSGERLNVGMSDLSSGAPLVLGWLSEHGHHYQHVHSERGDLEAVFLALTGKTLRDS